MKLPHNAPGNEKGTNLLKLDQPLATKKFFAGMILRTRQPYVTFKYVSLTT